MGNLSYLRFIPAPGSTTKINWTHVPEASKKAVERYGYDWERDRPTPLPKTVADLVKLFNGKKFIGYFEPDILTALMDISEFGLQAAAPTFRRSIEQVGPRFYMNYINEVWFILFAPGKRDCIIGHSDPIISKTESNDEMEANETAIAKEFDVKLMQDVSRGMGKLVKFNKKLCGWQAGTVQSNLEDSQYAESMMALPGSHPAQRAFMEHMFRDIYK